jgi:murein biosynthesis integral membrane protein MurJ
MSSAGEPGVITALIGRISAAHDNHRRIASGAVLIGVLTLGAKLFVAAREMAIAWRYGVSATVDAYQLAITITTWIPMLITGVMTVVLVPRLVSLDRSGSDRREFTNELNGTIVGIGIAVSLLIWLAAPTAANLLASRVNPDTQRATAAIASDIAPAAFCIIVCGYFSARLQSRERFSYSASDAVPAIAIVLLLVLPLKLPGVLPLIAGTVFGYFMQVVVLGRMVQRGDPPIGRLKARHSSPEWRSLYGAITLMALGQLLITMTAPIDQAFAARLGSGSVATLGYATRIITLLTGFGAVVVARALLPVISGAIADGNHALGRRQTLQWSALLGSVAAVGGGALWVIAPFVVRLLFERGAFDASASAAVAHVLRFGLVQLPFYFAGIAMVQWYAAARRFRAILAITACALVLKIALNAFLTPRLGVAGIALSTAGMYFLTSSLLAGGMRR